MDDGLVGLLQGALGGLVLIGAMYSPIVARSRYTAPRRLAEAEEKIRSKADLRRAYEILESLHHAGGMSISVPKKIRNRAKYLAEEMESEYQTIIEKEIRENIPKIDTQFSIGLSNRWTSVFSVDRVFSLEDLSPTYKEHFLAPEEKVNVAKQR